MVAKSVPTDRYSELKQMLEERRSQILADVRDKIRRVQSGDGYEVLDDGGAHQRDTDQDIEFALLQMKAETLNKISEALHRLQEGRYGTCQECGDPVATARLRALPFAIRCKDCEEEREDAARRDRVANQRRGAGILFS